MEKILCNFIEERTATIRVGEIIGPKFPLLSGVPQGSTLIPTLFIFYTAQMEQPYANCVDVSFADDNTQVIMYPLKSKEILAARTTMEIERINAYENKWKIKTNKVKFQLLSISATKPNDVIVDRQRIPFSNKVKVLGMEISTYRVVSHMNSRLALAKLQFTKLKKIQNT